MYKCGCGLEQINENKSNIAATFYKGLLNIFKTELERKRRK